MARGRSPCAEIAVAAALQEGAGDGSASLWPLGAWGRTGAAGGGRWAAARLFLSPSAPRARARRCAPRAVAAHPCRALRLGGPLVYAAGTRVCEHRCRGIAVGS